MSGPSRFSRVCPLLGPAFPDRPRRDLFQPGSDVGLLFPVAARVHEHRGVDAAEQALNATGFLVEFNNDADATMLSMKPPYITGAKRRYRLIELLQPTENLTVFSDSANTSDLCDGPFQSGVRSHRQRPPI